MKPLIIGALTFLPGVPYLFKRKGTGGTSSAAYCYGVWLKHLTLLHRHGMRSVPDAVAELGPGDSLGVGIAALLCGASRYYAADAVRYASIDSNLNILDGLVDLFSRRAQRPEKGWPDYDHALDERLFPGDILTDELLRQSLQPARIAAIRAALAAEGRGARGGIEIRYVAPWHGPDAIPAESVDVVLSHAVLQSVSDLPGTYAALARWMKPGSYMSHQIDYGSFNTAPAWNGHWGYYDAMWRLVAGRRPYLINRAPHSTHVELMRSNGLEIVCELTREPLEQGIGRSELSRRWRHLTDEDLACRAAFVQARKPGR